jgi:hypothetical protein
MFRPAPVTMATLPVSSWGFMGFLASLLAPGWSCLGRRVGARNKEIEASYYPKAAWVLVRYDLAVGPRTEFGGIAGGIIDHVNFRVNGAEKDQSRSKTSRVKNLLSTEEDHSKDPSYALLVEAWSACGNQLIETQGRVRRDHKLDRKRRRRRALMTSDTFVGLSLWLCHAFRLETN